MRTRYLFLVAILLLYTTMFLPASASTTTQTSTGNSRDITVITKTVCFNITASDPISNESITKDICVVIDLHVRNTRPTAGTINVTLPVAINVGNNTITKKVIVPITVEGEVSKIIVRSVNSSSTSSSTSNSENVIVVAPHQTSSTTTTNTVKRTTSSVQHTTTQSKQTVTKVVTHTVAETNKPNSNNMNDTVLTILIVVILLGVGVLVLYKKPVKKEEKEKVGGVEDYEEALKLLKQKLNEKEQELEKTRNTFPYKVKCPHCNNLVTPVVTDDNRLLCPACHQEIGRVKPDGSLELYSTTNTENTSENDEVSEDNTDNTNEGPNNNTKSRRRRRKN